MATLETISIKLHNGSNQHAQKISMLIKQALHVLLNYEKHKTCFSHFTMLAYLTAEIIKGDAISQEYTLILLLCYVSI